EPEPEPESTNTSSTGSGTGFGFSGGFSGGGQVLGAAVGPNGEELSCPAFITGFIFPGKPNNVDNVVHLQIFLNYHENAGLAITGVYDAPTIAAVHAFQTKYANEILAPWVNAGLMGSLTSTGNVYKTTQWWINVTVCGMLTPAPTLQ
ncbi:MAG: peptidoglycan-binding domain-containing protein, partial [Candidatus Paceibacterota bacterium]